MTTSRQPSRRTFWLAAIAGALVVTACRWQTTSNSSRQELTELAAALMREPVRPIEGRLAGFSYQPPPSPTRGARSRSVSPDVRIAVARIEKVAVASREPRWAAALGAAYLALGEWSKGVQLLEDAVTDEPENATFLNDLAAAYLARAVEDQGVDDWARGLTAANRAIRFAPLRPEPRFNRALALRGMHLRSQATEAWTDYAKVELSAQWLAEIQASQSERVFASGPLRENPVDLQPLRDAAEGQLARWASATVDGRHDLADRALNESQSNADALDRRGGDVMVRDELQLIRKIEGRGDKATLRRLAEAHLLFAQSRAQSSRENLEVASDLMSIAASKFRAAGSSYALWAPIARATLLRHQKASALGLRGLRRIALATVPLRYHNLRGRLAWTEGVLWGAMGRYDLERDPMERSIREFQRAGEVNQVIGAQTILAEVDWFLGDPTGAWSNVLGVLELVARQEVSSGQPSTLSYHLTIGATVAIGLDLPEAALDFLNARVRVNDGARSEGYGHLLRARLLAQIGDDRAAAADLDRASAAFGRLEDASLREETAADVDIAYAELLRRTNCREAIRRADAALPSVRRAVHSIRIVGLLAVKAHCRQSLGDLEGAATDLAAAAATFESRRSGFTSSITRIQAFEAERSAFKALVELEAVTRGDERAGLRAAERGRAGVLSEQWGVAVDATDERYVPDDVAVIYYESLDDRVLTWVLTRGRRVMLTQPMGADRLRRLIGRIHREIERGASVESLRQSSHELVTALVAPALDAADTGLAAAGKHASTVVFVPDGPLFSVPLGALPDTHGQPLLRTRTVAVAPSLAAFHAASRSLATFVPSSVLAIGDGHDPSRTRLPVLSHADGEAANVRRLYPAGIALTGAMATRARVLRERHPVLHFAGHTVVNERFPMHSQLLLAPAVNDDPGGLLGADITAEHFSSTGVVVLATCDGAAGSVVEGEGAISVARTFFAAGVPAVVASLWSVPDDLEEFALTFHRELTTGRDAAHALRIAQLAVLDRRGAQTPVRVWGGFIMFGGLGRAHARG